MANLMRDGKVPYSFTEITMSQAHSTPTMQYIDSAAHDYWCRALYERALTVFEWTVPKAWEGQHKDFLLYLLYSQGYVGIINTEDYGVIFQPCTLGPDRDVMYQPTGIMVANPYDANISKDYTLGVDAEILKMTPDFRGVFDVIDLYARRLAGIATAIHAAIMNAPPVPIYGARSKTGAAALRIMSDKVYSGDPFVILDSQIMWPDAKTKEDAIFDITPKRDYVVDKLLDAERELLRAFDSAVGIPNIDDKKERLVTSEAESKQINATAVAFEWYDCLKDSIDKIKSVFPEIELDVKLRYSEVTETTDEEDTDDGLRDTDTERN